MSEGRIASAACGALTCVCALQLQLRVFIELDYSYSYRRFPSKGQLDRMRLQVICFYSTYDTTNFAQTSIHSDRHHNKHHKQQPHTNTYHTTHTAHIRQHFFSGCAHISPYLSDLSSLFSCTSHLPSGFFNLPPFLLASLISFPLACSRTSPVCPKSVDP